MKKVVFWGGTGQAKMLRESLPQDIKLEAIFENNNEIKSPFEDVPIYYGEKGFANWYQAHFEAEQTYFAIAIGGKLGKVRIELAHKLREKGLKDLTIIDSTAYIANTAQLGKGIQILPQAAICTEVKIGEYTIINTGATVDHESQIGKGVHICPGSHLAGLVKVHDYATIYTGATILPRIQIGEGAIVGAGAVVIRDVKPYTMVMGNPARERRSGI